MLGGPWVHSSRNMVLLKDRKDQEREHKNTRYLYIWVTGQVTERVSKAGEGSCLQRISGIFLGEKWRMWNLFAHHFEEISS